MRNMNFKNRRNNKNANPTPIKKNTTGIVLLLVLHLHVSCKSLRFIQGVQKKAERQIFSTLQATSLIFTSLDKASSAEENDTKIKFV